MAISWHSKSKKDVQILIEGYTLIELLIALALSGAIILAAMHYYAMVTTINRSIKAASLQLEDERYTFFFINKHLTGADIHIQNPSKINSTQSKVSGDVIATSDSYFYVAATKHSRYLWALFFKQGNKPRVELAGNVVNMQVSYGIKCKDSVNICQYISAQQVTDSADVASVAIVLTRSSSCWQSHKQPIYVALKPR